MASFTPASARHRTRNRLPVISVTTILRRIDRPDVLPCPEAPICRYNAPGPMTVAQPTVGGIQLLDVLTALRALGAEPARLCAVAAIEVDALRHPDARVPGTKLMEVLA